MNDINQEQCWKGSGLLTSEHEKYYLPNERRKKRSKRSVIMRWGLIIMWGAVMVMGFKMAFQ
jgi:hypothetical protein